jgi:S-adenosylhomocysteine hydrolase
MNRWCPENDDVKRKREDDEDDYKESKKARLEEQIIIDEGGDIAFTITRRHVIININMLCFRSINRYPYGLFVASVYLIMNFFG